MNKKNNHIKNQTSIKCKVLDIPYFVLVNDVRLCKILQKHANYVNLFHIDLRRNMKLCIVF